MLLLLLALLLIFATAAIVNIHTDTHARAEAEAEREREEIKRKKENLDSVFSSGEEESDLTKPKASGRQHDSAPSSPIPTLPCWRLTRRERQTWA